MVFDRVIFICIAYNPFLEWRQKYMNLSFAKDIRPLFREKDVDTMNDFGLDLSSYEEVKGKAHAIYATLENGSMPCDEPWPKGQVALFKRWIDEGMAA